jgi:hypothetical protein
VEAEGIRPLQVLLAHVVRRPSHPRTTALDAGHPGSGIWKQGDLHDWQPHHTSPSYFFPLPITRLNTSLLSPRVHVKGDELCHFCVTIPRGGANTHTHQYSLYSPALLTYMKEPAPQREKRNTSAQHEPRACARRPRGRSQDCHITDVIYLTQASRDSRSILENVYDVSKSRHGSRRPSCHVGPRYCSAQP